MMLGVIREAFLAPTARPLGKAGERFAAKYLRRAGYRVLGRNVRSDDAEADLVCLCPERRTLVIVEVKTRLGPSTPTRNPEQAITSHKRAKLVSIARTLRTTERWEDRPIRIDVVAIDWPKEQSRRPQIRHYINAVTSR